MHYNELHGLSWMIVVWIIVDYNGLPWIMEYHGLAWITVGYCGVSWIIMGYHELWTIMD
jgi:hypothetical protein